MHQEMIRFLVDAKRGTYAATGDDESVPPALPDSKQLEYRSGNYPYRDIYFGMEYFVGQEAVPLNEKVVWSMMYASGVAPLITNPAEVRDIYVFLRKALRGVEERCPFRGLASFPSWQFPVHASERG